MPQQKWLSFFLLGLFSLGLFLSGITTLPVIDRDEAHFAQASRQMVQTGNYFQIRFQDKTRFQKPPGINWLQAASVNLFSNGEAPIIWPYRLPSVVSALASVWLTYFFATYLLSRRGAILAAAFLASSLLLVVEAHMAVIDTSLLAAVLLMQLALWNVYRHGGDKKLISWFWPMLFWLAMAYGFVLKGVTPLVGFLTCVSLSMVDKQLAWLRGLRIYSGLILFAVLSISWLWVLNTQEQSNYLMQMLHKDLLPKLQGGHESHGKPPLFHLFILPVTFWPASLFLWLAAVHAVRHRQQRVVKFLLAWILPTWIFFELMPTKLPQYILPTLPAIAILCALAIELNTAFRGQGFLRFLQALWWLVSLGLALSLVWVYSIMMHQGSFALLLLALVMVSFSGMACYYSWFRRPYQASLTILMMALLAYPLIFAVILPELKPIWLSKRVAQLFDKKKISKKKPLLVVGFEEPSLVFNLNTDLVSFVDESTAKALLKHDSSRLLLFEPSYFKPWKNEQINHEVVAYTQGYNYSKGRWITLYLVNGGEVNVTL